MLVLQIFVAGTCIAVAIGVIAIVIRQFRRDGNPLRRLGRRVAKRNQRAVERYLSTCRQCGFELAGSPSGQCPECGHQNPPRPGSLGMPASEPPHGNYWKAERDAKD